MKKKSLILISGILILGLAGCGKISFSYGNGGVSAYRDYDSAEDFEKDLEARVKEEELKQELEEELSDIDLLDSATNEKKGLFSKKIDGNHMKIAGDEYDMSLDGRVLFGQMAKNGMLIIDGNIMKPYGEDGELLDTESMMMMYSKDFENEFFKDGKVKSKYKGKTIYGLIETLSDLRRIKYILYLEERTKDSFGSKMPDYKTPDGLTQKTSEKDLDTEKWLNVGRYGMFVGLLQEDPRYCSIFAGKDQVDLSKYTDRIDKMLEENGNDRSALFDYVSGELHSVNGYPYGQTFMMMTADEIPDIDSVSFKNSCAVNLALAECYKKIDAGELDHVIILTMEWDVKDPDLASLGISMYK